MHFIVLLLLIAPIFASTKSDDQGARHADKTGNARQNAQGKKKVPPPAAPKPAQSEVDKPTFQYNQTYAEQSDKQSHGFFHNLIDILNAASTLVIAAFTVVLSIVGIRQFQATRTAERAWVVCQAPDPPPINPEGDVAIRWVVENKGRTPARVTALGSAARIIKAGDALPEEPPYTMAGPFTPEGTVLPPSAKASRGVNIPAATMAAVEHGQQDQEYVLYVFGIVKYRDSFGSKHEHETRYCFRFKPGPTEADPAPRDFYVDGPPSYNRAT
jgi:hypothetical protein